MSDQEQSGIAALGRLMTAITRADRVERVYDAALDALHDGLGVQRASILLFDPDGVMRFKAWRNLSDGYRQAVEGHTPWRPDSPDARIIVLPDVREDPELAPYLPTIAAEGIAAMVFVPLKKADGVIGKFMLYFETPGAFDEAAQTLADVIASQVAFAVQRLDAERAVKASEAELKFVTDVAPVYIAHCDRDLRYVFVNRPFASRFGRTPQEIVGRTVPEVLGTAAYERIRREMETTLSGSRVQFEIELPYEHLGSRVVQASLVPDIDAQGQVLGFVAVISDVTERRLSELEKTEARFQQIADFAPVLIWSSAPDRSFDWFNQGWLQFTGRTIEQERGIGWADKIHPDDRDRCLAAYDAAFASRRPFEIEYRLRRHDDEYRWLLDVGRPVVGRDGEFDGYIGTCADITDRKRFEEEREGLLASERAARQQAESTNRIKDEFLNTLSHELRTPLNAILGWTQLLQHSTPGPASETLTRALATVERNARLQTQLIDDLLDMSRILSGKVRLDVQLVTPVTVVESAIDSIRPHADAKGLLLQVSLDQHAGPVSGDPTRLQQVIWNLLSNAVKFTRGAGTIQVTLTRLGSQIEISVTDTGIGIQPEFLPYVFERFRQQDSSIARQHAGLGLGLSIARHLVELHGGTVEASSAGRNQGATFTVTLPVAVPDADDARPQLANAKRAWATREASPALQHVSVLVVDDDEDSRAIVSLLLTECGASVRTAASGPAALEALQEQLPDVLVSDIGMPGQDGYQLLRAIRELGGDHEQLPALALTAYARSDDRLRALQAGFQMHLAKPIEAAELCTAVASLARMHDVRSS